MGDLRTLYADPTAIKYAQIAASGSGTATVVAAVAGKRIRVLAVYVQATTATTSATFKSSTTAITPAVLVQGSGPIRQAFVGGCFETAAGEALNVTAGAGGDINGFLTYVEV